MTPLRPIYLAAPLSAPTEPGRIAHLLAAHDLRTALEADPSIMVYLPHERIARRYGYPAAEETPQDRLQALDECMAALRMVYGARGALHVLARPDGTLSPGCAAEVEHWQEMGGGAPVVWHRTETGWTSAGGEMRR